MTESKYNNQNPSGIWQGTWANIINSFNDEIINRNYATSWELLQNLIIEIPPECQAEIEKTYKTTEGIMNAPIQGYNYVAASRNKNRQIQQEAPKAQRELMKQIIMSLFKNGWINKNFNVQPLKTNIPHIHSDPT